MKTLIVIPTYWVSARYNPSKRKNLIYDHPTPLDRDGTFIRAIESLKKIKGNDFELLVLASAASKNIKQEMNKKLRKALNRCSKKNKIKIHLLSDLELEDIKKIIHKYYPRKYDVFLGSRGYSRVRNLSLIAAQILDADILVSIDDDEYITDPNFLMKAKEFITHKHNGKTVDGTAGYYVYEDNRIHLGTQKHKWSSVWDKSKKMNDAFDKFIKKGPRLKEAHFILGGCTVLHKNIFKKIPFDFKISRGEDIDYLINARMFGFNIFFDNELYIRHDPPATMYPLWKSQRADIYRFIYEREKINQQKRRKGIHKVTLSELSPYPSAFLNKNLDIKIKKSCEIIAQQYKALGDEFSASESLKNIELAKTKAMPKYNVFKHILSLQKKWESFSKVIEKKEIKKALKKCIVVFES